VNSLPKTVTRQRCGCDLNQGPSGPESSTLTTRLLSHPCKLINIYKTVKEAGANSALHMVLNMNHKQIPGLSRRGENTSVPSSIIITLMTIPHNTKSDTK